MASYYPEKLRCGNGTITSYQAQEIEKSKPIKQNNKGLTQRKYLELTSR